MDDLRGIPTTVCICGSMMFKLKVIWDQETKEVGMYMLDQECVECGTITTAPTPIDEELNA